MASVDHQKDQGLEPPREREKEKQQKEKEREPSNKQTADGEGETNKVKRKRKDREEPSKEIIDPKLSGEKEAARSEEKTGDVEPMDICTVSASLPCEFPSSDVLFLEGHTSEVYSCGWSPDGSLLASGGADSTARLWAIGDGPPNSTIQSRPVNVLVLKHLASRPNVSKRDVTTLDWNSESTHLATGSYDGQARIWTRTGELVSTLNNHISPIFSLRWNKKGDYLLSGSADKTVVAWDVKSGECLQKFSFHSGPILDVDWRNNNCFASCSSDKMVYVCKVGENRPVKTFSEHQNEINTVKWDPSGSLLASCSDDTTAKIWSMKQDTCIQDLRGHFREIYTLTWSPTGAGTSNANRQLMLASASFDSTVKLWDVELGRCLHSLESHREPVYAVKFSPNCEYVASGSLDKSLIIWSVKEGKIVRSYTGGGGIFELSWHKEGNNVAAGFADGRVCVFDIRM